MKKVLYIIVSFLIIGAMIFGGIYLNQKSIDNAYNYAITLIQNGSYEGALGELEKANPNLLNRKEFKDDIKYQKLDEAYKNTVPLYAYALAQSEYNDENKSMYTVNDYLELISTDYSGELCEEIKTFKGTFKPQYDEFLEEEKRKAEELRLLVEESNRQFYAKLKNKIPYEGMSESYIDLTAMGKHHAYESSVIGKGKRNEHIEHEYKWMTNSGKTILIVDCEDGVVESVYKYGEDKYWTADGKPIYSGTRSGYSSSSSGKKKVYNDDSYNVNDYYDAEDFYEDYYDDFYDYEEAEDYYNEHHKD